MVVKKTKEDFGKATQNFLKKYFLITIKKNKNKKLCI